MFKWIQGGISAVTGIAEPEYGEEYINTAVDRVKEQKIQPCQKVTRADLCWLTPEYTNVETATFYFNDLDSCIVGLAQVIHSNIAGLHTTSQFTCRIYDTRHPEELNVWSSTKLENFRIEGTNFYADNLSIELNEASNKYHVVSNVNENTNLDLFFTQITEGCKLGTDPTTYYGDNIEEPWGKIRHIFWPRNKVVGTVSIKYSICNEENSEEGDQEKLITKTLNFTEEAPALSMFVLAFQGIKPHHAAKSWNFINFHSKEYSAILIEFITPKSYAHTKVSVGIVTDDKNILALTVDNDFKHVDSTVDSVGWPVPKSFCCKFNGLLSTVSNEKIQNDETTDADKFTAVVETPLNKLIERIDVMNEVPQFVKNIVSGVVGTKPYIYQYADDADFSITVGNKKVKGLGLTEVIFISESESLPEADSLSEQ